MPVPGGPWSRLPAILKLLLFLGVLLGQWRLTEAEWAAGQQVRLDLEPLFATWLGLGVSLLTLALTMLCAWRLHAGGTTLSRHVSFVLYSAIPAFFCFEIAHLFSRLPPISDVSLSHSLRPWSRCLTISLAVFLVCWLGLALNAVNSSWPSRKVDSDPGHG